ncbi:MAG TPA: TIGR03790 family protein, partial [Verrucomicrobiota bacterium]|nr:TIGR03790 family protein [Verrucomicrobiota bacterium]
MKRFYILVVLPVLLAAVSTVRSQAGGDEVVVVYNSANPESKAVAEYYAKRRDVPRDRVWGFDMSKTEEISRPDFRSSIQQALLKKLESSGLWKFGRATVVDTNGQPVVMDDRLIKSDIRYVVLCYGVPLKIREDTTLAPPGMDPTKPDPRRNQAAVDSELSLLPWVYQRQPLSGPLRNPLYTATNSATLHPTNGVLMVARVDGPTADIARGLVDKALDAEKNGMWGRAYFDVRNLNDVNYKLGDDWIRNAAEICRRLGFDVIIDENATTFPASFPMSQVGYYCGWYDGNVSGPFLSSEVEFLPGAFAYHLHSFSAHTIRSRDRNWVGPLLDRGATITMGSVYEPYLSGTPDLGIFTARLILHGMSFGEAAYASQSVLSWQTTVVGDPLYRPFGKPAQQLHMELEAAKSPLTEWSHLRVINLNIANGMPPAQMLNYLEQIPNTKQSAVLSEKLGDLCNRLGKPSSAIFAYEQALNLNPSPQQRARLRLVLADRQLAVGDEAGAYENYRKLVVDDW